MLSIYPTICVLRSPVIKKKQKNTACMYTKKTKTK